MRKSTITAHYTSDVKTVWDMVTDNSDYAWRSDLNNIEVLGEDRFIEYTKEGFSTEFLVTHREPYERYEFLMKNKNFEGHWVGLFEIMPSGGTMITFTEELSFKNPVMELLSYIGMPLKKIQQTYAEDLRHALGEDK